MTDGTYGVRLGLDWGKARIGVAACDAAGVLAYPVETITPASDRRVVTERLLRLRDRLRIAIHQQQPAVGSEPGQHLERVAAASERAVQIAAIRTYGESLHGFVKQYGDVVKAAINSHRIKSRSSSGMAPGC